MTGLDDLMLNYDLKLRKISASVAVFVFSSFSKTTVLV